MPHSSIVYNSTCQGMEYQKFFMALSLAAWNSDSLRKLINSSMSHRHPGFPKAMVLRSAQCKQPRNCSRKLMRIRKIPYLGYLAILELRNTPIPLLGLSPTQLLMGRRTGSIIPIKSTLLTPMTYNAKEDQSALEARQQIQTEYFDRSSKALKPLEPGDTIRMRQGNTWEPAVLVGESKVGEPRTYIGRANNHEYRRSRKDILKTQETSHPGRASRLSRK